MENSGNSELNTSNGDLISKIVKRAQLVLVLICAIAFIAALIIYSLKIKNETIHYTFNHTICTDSLGVISAESKALADSIFNEIQKHERILEDKYQYFIEQKSNTQDLLTIGSIILGIIVSMVGFFGYSTIQSIEEKAKKIGEDAAKDKFNDTNRELIDKRFSELKTEKLWPEFNKRIDDKLNKFENEKMSDIDDLRIQMDSIQDYCDDLRENYQQSDKFQKPSTDDDNRTEGVKPEPNEF